MRWMRGAALATIIMLETAPIAGATETYAIDQRFGDILFKVSHLGLYSSEGTFRRFTGRLTIDEAEPRNTRINVMIDTDSVAMGWAGAVAMLRSPPYFDVTRYPDARFTSTRVIPERTDHYEIDGDLELRGVTQALVLHAALLDRRPGTAAGETIADFVVTGVLRRSAFGMTADPSFISDRVNLRIHARVRLEAAAPHE